MKKICRLLIVSLLLCILLCGCTKSTPRTSEKTDITGMDYAPEHYRYVGQEAAAAMAEQGVCLEEYLLGQPR